ncbi:MAG: RdgB/HAM1 family non-canonical purine NTP pyrophosphatase [bacterium]|nr:RdgB/HAM1 family non-canonical purine NTP pyrophosphatase [bacterium]
MIDNLTFITGNAGKAAELQAFLNIAIKHIKLDLPEIQSLDLKEISSKKAESAFSQISKPVLVEDVGLTFKSMGNLPGPFIKWFLTELKNDGLCKLLAGFEDKSATANIIYTIYDGKQMTYFEGECEGTISDLPRGENGFGWDQIFIPLGQEKTYAQMSIDEKNIVSHRGKALQKLQQYFNDLGKNA